VGWAKVIVQSNRVLDGRTHWHHLANTVERLCAAVMSGSGALSPGVATRPVPKLLWAILFYVYTEDIRVKQLKRCQLHL